MGEIIECGTWAPMTYSCSQRHPGLITLCRIYELMHNGFGELFFYSILPSAIEKVCIIASDGWHRHLALSPKTKTHLRSCLPLIYLCYQICCGPEVKLVLFYFGCDWAINKGRGERECVFTSKPDIRQSVDTQPHAHITGIPYSRGLCSS